MDNCTIVLYKKIWTMVQDAKMPDLFSQSQILATIWTWFLTSTDCRHNKQVDKHKSDNTSKQMSTWVTQRLTL